MGLAKLGNRDAFDELAKTLFEFPGNQLQIKYFRMPCTTVNPTIYESSASRSYFKMAILTLLFYFFTFKYKYK